MKGENWAHVHESVCVWEGVCVRDGRDRAREKSLKGVFILQSKK